MQTMPQGMGRLLPKTKEEEQVIDLRQSSLQTFLDCRRKFFLEVTKNLAPAPVEGLRKVTTADNGTMVHEVLRMYYEGELSDDVTAEQCGDIIHDWVKEQTDSLDSDDTTAPHVADWYKSAEMATTMSHGYINWVEQTGQDLRFTPWSVEQRIHVDISGTDIQLSGQLDLVLFDELIGEYGILDHKTVARLDPPRAGNFQLLTYGWLFWQDTGIVPTWAGHNQIKRNKQTSRAKPPFYDRPTLNLNEEMLENHGRMINSLCRDIQQAMMTVDDTNHRDHAYPNMTSECDWKCDVKGLCDVMHDADEVWVDIASLNYIQRKERT